MAGAMLVKEAVTLCARACAARVCACEFCRRLLRGLTQNFQLSLELLAPLLEMGSVVNLLLGEKSFEYLTRRGRIRRSL